MRKIMVGLVIAITMGSQMAYAQRAAPGDWPHFNRDQGSSRYSPLDQITADNIIDLQPAWTYTPASEAPGELLDWSFIAIEMILVVGSMAILLLTNPIEDAA